MTIVSQLYVPLLNRLADGFIVASFFVTAALFKRIFVFLSRPGRTTKHLLAGRVEWGLGNKMEGLEMLTRLQGDLSG